MDLLWDKKTVLSLLLIFLALYLFSYLGFLYPFINTIFFWLLIGATVILTIKRLKYGVFIVVAELFIGSKGYLFSFSLGGFVISLRLALFITVFLIWLITRLKSKEIGFLKTNYRLPFFLFVLFLIIGVILGFLRNEPKIVFFDMNAYLYFAFIFVVFDALNIKENLYRLLKILAAGVLALTILTIFILSDFGVFHYSQDLINATKVEAKQLEELAKLSDMPENARLAQTTQIAQEKLRIHWEGLTQTKDAIYRWLRDTGTGEVTYIGGRFFRVFMPSHFYVVVYLLILMSFIFNYKNKFFTKENKFLIILLITSLLVTFVSFSRSLWLGLGAAFIFLLFLIPWQKSLKILGITIILLAVFLGLVFIAAPQVGNLVKERISSVLQPSSELAATNRMSLFNPLLEKIKERPFFGSGFGTLITFKSLVPNTDIVEYIKVYLYEWAYLDIIVKIGILGLGMYLYFLAQIIKNAVKVIKVEDGEVIKTLHQGILAALISLLVINITTPYLNHPLGIGYVIIASLYFWLFLRAKQYGQA